MKDVLFQKIISDQPLPRQESGTAVAVRKALATTMEACLPLFQ
jgi:hypothetical protein